MSTMQDILDMHRELVEDQIDSDVEAHLYESAKRLIELEQELYILQKTNTSLSTTAGGTWQTAISMAGITDFVRAVKSTIYVNNFPYYEVPYALIAEFKDTPYRYAIDRVNQNLYLCGVQGQSATIRIPYIYRSADGAPVWPSEFWPAIAFRMNRLYYGKDGQEKEYSMRAEWKEEEKELISAMKFWDHGLKLAAMSQSVASPGTYDPGFPASAIPR